MTTIVLIIIILIIQVSQKPGSRRPPCDTLYDVFQNIKDDEGEHVATMKACQNYATLGKVVVSPHLGRDYFDQKNTDSSNNDREEWIQWAEQINKL